LWLDDALLSNGCASSKLPEITITEKTNALARYLT
jgi:hypothetical protein